MRPQWFVPTYREKFGYTPCWRSPFARNLSRSMAACEGFGARVRFVQVGRGEGSAGACGRDASLDSLPMGDRRRGSREVWGQPCGKLMAVARFLRKPRGLPSDASFGKVILKRLEAILILRQ